MLDPVVQHDLVHRVDRGGAERAGEPLVRRQAALGQQLAAVVTRHEVPDETAAAAQLQAQRALVLVTTLQQETVDIKQQTLHNELQ